MRELVHLGIMDLSSILSSVELEAPAGDVQQVSLDGCRSLVSLRPSLQWDYFVGRGFDENDSILWNVMVRDVSGALVFPLMDGDRCVYCVEKDIRLNRWYVPKGIAKDAKWLRLVNPSSKDVAVVEGIFDGMRITQAGHNVLVLLGTRISSDVCSYLVDRMLQPIFFLDGDQAGDKLCQSLLRDYAGKGFRFVQRPEGKDPADLSIGEVQKLLSGSTVAGLKDRLELQFRSKRT